MIDTNTTAAFSIALMAAVCIPCFSLCQDLLTVVKFPDCCLWVCSFFVYGKQKQELICGNKLLSRGKLAM